MKKDLIIIVIGILIIAAIVAFLVWRGPAEGTPTDLVEVVKESGLIVKDVVLGSGKEARAGDTVAVHYVGRFEDGTIFDTSLNTGNPLAFVLGQGYVIPGWEEGLLGMKPGGVRELTIPPDLAYGEAGIGTIPPNTTLHFEVELLEIQN